MKHLLIFSFLFSSDFRIESIIYKRNEVLKIDISHGLVSKVRFPCEIQEVFSSKIDSFFIQISERFPRELNISFTDQNAKPLNLIVKCNQNEDFVIDLVPNKSLHKDLTVISRASGSINRNHNTNEKLVSSSKEVIKKPELKRVLIKESLK